MDKDILTNILNRLEDKVDKISTGLTTNTSVTGSHTKMLEDMKGVHDVNAKIILETRDQVKDLNNTVISIVSWKGGQIKATEQNIHDIKTIHERLSAIEQDYFERRDKKKDLEKNIQQEKVGLLRNVIEKAIYAIVGAILISWQEIANKLFN